MSVLKGVLFSFLMLFSSTFGAIFLLIPLIPLIFFQPKVGRQMMDQMIWIWQIYAVFLVEKLCGVKVVITGEPVGCEDSTIILMNHRTRFDWLFIFSYILRHGPLRRFKISMKDILKYVPGPGWAMQCAGYLFLQRKWEADKKIILRCLTYFRKLGYKPQILFFPEGTDFTANTKARSDKFAAKNSLEPYEYVLHPRTAGFSFLVEKMREIISLDSILDVSIGYPENIPQNERDILEGKFPQQVHFHVQAHNASELPPDREGVEKWCQECWERKERQLREYYTGSKVFSQKPIQTYVRNEQEVEHLFKFACLFWTVFQICVVVFLIYAPILRWFSLFSIITYVLISRYGGIDALLDSEASDLCK